jgi:hypothetical protein
MKPELIVGGYVLLVLLVLIKFRIKEKPELIVEDLVQLVQLVVLTEFQIKEKPELIVEDLVMPV